MKHSNTTVDLSMPAGERWRLSEAQQAGARGLTQMYFQDLGIDEGVSRYVQEVAREVVPATLMEEMEAVATSLEVEPGRVIVANLYYDLLKSLLGCTAFAVAREGGPFHARNLDWWTQDDALAELTMVTKFVNGPHGDFVTIGWPGLVGAFSGMAEGRFSVSLNAVLSDAPVEIAMSVVMLIRDVLENTPDFDSAVKRLSHTPIANDCLLLVTGLQAGQAVVIERTPTKSAERWIGNAPYIAVTNDYRALDAASATPSSELIDTACSRRERVELLLKNTPPDLATCLSYLADDEVMMQITVQQMAFHAASGDFALLSEPSS